MLHDTVHSLHESTMSNTKRYLSIHNALNTQNALPLILYIHMLHRKKIHTINQYTLLINKSNIQNTLQTSTITYSFVQSTCSILNVYEINVYMPFDSKALSRD